MKKTRKVFSVLLVIIMVSALSPVTVQAAEPPQFTNQPSAIVNNSTSDASYIFTASGDSPITYSIAETLPTGMSLTDNILNISQTVAKGVYFLTVEASNTYGSTTQDFILVVIDGSFLDLNIATIVNNTTPGNGGGVSTGTGGGAILTQAQSIRAYKSEFTSNAAIGISSDGGAVYAGVSTGSILFDSCIFTSNSAIRNGGAVAIENGDIVLFRDCVFSDNTAGGQGNAIYIENASEVFFIDCVFGENDTVFVKNGTIIADTPTVTGISPADGDSDVPVTTTKLQLSFSERVKGMSGKNVVLTAGGETIPIQAETAVMSKDGKTATLSLPAILDYSKTYEVSIDNGGFQSMTLQDIEGQTVGSFTTVDEPVLTVSPVNLNFGNITLDTTSDPQTVLVSGSALTDDIAYEITGADADVFSVKENSWSASEGGSLDVDFTPTEPRTFKATLTIKSADASDQTVALSGTGISKNTPSSLSDEKGVKNHNTGDNSNPLLWLGIIIPLLLLIGIGGWRFSRRR